MKRFVSAGLLIPVAIGIGSAGYWLGRRNAELPAQIASVTTPEPASASTSSAAAKKKVLYYRDPMGKPDFSPVPMKDSMGMDYLPVYEGEDTGKTTADIASSSKGKGKILYYRNP